MDYRDQRSYDNLGVHFTKQVDHEGQQRFKVEPPVDNQVILRQRLHSLHLLPKYLDSLMFLQFNRQKTIVCLKMLTRKRTLSCIPAILVLRDELASLSQK